ncbi:hypothetical protein BBP00_00008504, partial [Phytophthora kernoviae]
MAGFAIQDDQHAPPMLQAEHAAAEEQHNDVAGHEDPASPPANATPEAAQPPVQGGRPRRSSIRAMNTSIGEPFAFPRREWMEDRDVEMENVSEEQHEGMEEKN